MRSRRDMHENDSARRRRLRRPQPISRIFPNMVTICGLCCGLSSVRFAMAANWEMAVSFIVAAALIDGMDGRIARMLGATSLFGAQLDSLSDFVCFGVAPALVVYMWQLHEIKGIGWALVLFFAVCCALRLARFNTALQDDKIQPWQKNFFVGVPSPAGGLLCLVPIIVSMQSEGEFQPPVALTMLNTLLVAVLMASRVPTFAGKNLRIDHDMIPRVMIGAALAIVVFINAPWLAISCAGIFYLASIPVSVLRYRRLKSESNAESPAEE
jgi:CDP-diacylglycerol--serine O-phosphatidyltransferase